MSEQEKSASGILERIQSFAEKNPTLASSLLAGAGGAAAGAIMTGDSDDPHETPGQKRMRRLRNALIAGGLAGGGMAAGRYAVDKLTSVKPSGDKDPETEISEWAEGLPLRPLGATAGFTGGLMSQNRTRTKATKDILARYFKETGLGDPKAALRSHIANGDLGKVVGQVTDTGKPGKLTKTLPEVMGKELTRAGISTKGLGSVDTQVKLLPKVLQKNRIAQGASRFLSRNMKPTIGGLAGLLLPEIASGVGYGAKKLLNID